MGVEDEMSKNEISDYSSDDELMNTCQKVYNELIKLETKTQL